MKLLNMMTTCMIFASISINSGCDKIIGKKGDRSEGSSSATQTDPLTPAPEEKGPKSNPKIFFMLAFENADQNGKDQDFDIKQVAIT
ncbi:MAG: hypothetical protein HQK54_18480, partial [Oligoflexales bacterium]|nr:hypothetical protein [Oligoflexales bacterium]